MKWFTVPALSVAAGALVLIGSACGGDDDDATGGMAHGSAATVTAPGGPGSGVMVSLSNWSVAPSDTTLAAGEVKFTASHAETHMGGMDDGGATHQLVVARLPEGARAGEGKFTGIVLNLADIKPGESKDGKAELAPGSYELACLVVEEVKGKTVNHYEKGMFTSIVVK